MLLAVLASVIIGGAPQPTSIADRGLTPGAVRPDLTIQQLCTTKWGHDHRAVTEAMKRQVFARYGFTGDRDPRCTASVNDPKQRCEVDHRVPRCLGGADVIENLSPQPYGGPWNAFMKDRVEGRACKAVCARVKPGMPLDAARLLFLGDWTTTYRRWFGEPPQ